MTAPAPDQDSDFDELVDYLRQARGFDFTGYKREGLMRRFRKQMQMIGVDSFSDYHEYLEVHPGEFAALFNAVLINVTAFFRDPEAWDFLSREVLPPLLAAKGGTGPVRVWSAGCATGEEAYTLAIVLAERPRHGTVPGAGEDLRHRHRRGRSGPRPPGLLHRTRGRRYPGAATGQILSSATSRASCSPVSCAATSSSAATT